MKQDFLDEISGKLEERIPLSFEDGLRLFQEPDLLRIGALAHRLRTQLHGASAYYNWNLHLNATNVCEADCLFCSFARTQPSSAGAYSMNVNEALEWVAKRYRPGMTEIHIVNGLNPDLPFAYYEELLLAIRERFPLLHIKAFTAVEIHYFAQKFALDYETVLRRLMRAGLGSLPGGGAEIFSPRARRKICRQKADAEQWLEVHRTAHRIGLRSNCTMLYGTIETHSERVEHLLRLRALQDETGGLQCFVPLAFHNEGNRMSALPRLTAVEHLRMIAISRLLLHNIPHIKAYWVMLGIDTAQTALHFGADDLDGTVTEEKIYHMAGTRAPEALAIPEIRRLILQAGLVPVERSTLYQTLLPATPPLEQAANAVNMQ